MSKLYDDAVAVFQDEFKKDGSSAFAKYIDDIDEKSSEGDLISIQTIEMALKGRQCFEGRLKLAKIGANSHFISVRGNSVACVARLLRMGSSIAEVAQNDLLRLAGKLINDSDPKVARNSEIWLKKYRIR